MIKWFKSGAPWIWLTAGSVSVSLLAVLGLLLLIGWKGLSYFWPDSVYRFDITSNGKTHALLGEIYDQQVISRQQLLEAGVQLDPANLDDITRYVIKVGNREQNGSDFVTVLSTHIVQQQLADNVVVVDRDKNGKFYGYPVAIYEGKVELPFHDYLQLKDKTLQLRHDLEQLQQVEIASVNWQLEQLRIQHRKAELKGQAEPDKIQQYERQRRQLELEYKQMEGHLFSLQNQLADSGIIVRNSQGQQVKLPMDQVLDVWQPNNLTLIEKIAHWGHQVGKFLSEEPREANTEGGVFPAIFGTVFMVLLMSIIVTPLGVMAAVYLHEYAKKNAFTKVIRIAVINLAGVPSIVYGVFGLGFFVYMVGGTIDDLFFSAQLPTPTFGTPGVLWSALTLAILTLPVVIVSTEEGLARIPNSVRNGSLALGATQSETLWRIVLPMASPAIMTGLILAVARAAGEVAPLMLVGVVKMAPTLPVDLHFPYVHLDRKFMHLGYHIYDVAFQSPNVEAARPLVYATSFLLVTVIISLNLTAIGIRNYLREKYRTLEQ